jgi:hypothetical protein
LLDRAQRGAREADGVGGGAQVAGDDGEVAGFDGDVGAGADREGEVRLGERGASLTPSPTIATTRPSPWRRLMTSALSDGRTSVITSSMPTSAATARGGRVVAREQHAPHSERLA